MHDFHTFMLEGAPICTWSSNQAGQRQIWQRLDRFLGNGEAIASLPTLKVKRRIRFSSDHLPLNTCLIGQDSYSNGCGLITRTSNGQWPMYGRKIFMVHRVSDLLKNFVDLGKN